MPDPISFLTDFFQSENFLLHRLGKVHKHEMAFVIQVILTAFIHDPDQIILRRARIGENPIDFAADERRFVVRVINAERKMFGRVSHHSST